MNRITGSSAFLALLKDEGITHLFGNPGTTELPIMHALKDHPDLTYVIQPETSQVPSPGPRNSAHEFVLKPRAGPSNLRCVRGGARSVGAASRYPAPWHRRTK
jgi:hypothetical protein